MAFNMDSTEHKSVGRRWALVQQKLSKWLIADRVVHLFLDVSAQGGGQRVDGDYKRKWPSYPWKFLGRGH